MFSILLKVGKNESLYGAFFALASFFYAAFSGMITEVPYTTLVPSVFVIFYMILQRLFMHFKNKLNL